MQLIRRRMHRFFAQNAAGFILLIFSLTILTTDSSGKMGVFFAKWLTSVMHPIL
jgi:hypothetical protein